MGRKLLLNKPAKGINQTSSNGLGVARADGILGPGYMLSGGVRGPETRAQRRAREAIERKGGLPTKGTQRQ